MYKRGKELKEPDFNKIKELIGAGVPPKYIKEMTQRSGTTISLIKRFSAYQEYRDFVTERYMRSLQKHPRNVKNITVTEGGGDTDMLKILTTIEGWHLETNSLLNDMKKRLDFIESNMLIKEKSFLNGR